MEKPGYLWVLCNVRSIRGKYIYIYIYILDLNCIWIYCWSNRVQDMNWICTKDRNYFLQLLGFACVVTPNDMVTTLARFIEETKDADGNLIKHFTKDCPRADAAFQQMTFGGKVAVSKILRALLKNQD